MIQAIPVWDKDIFYACNGLRNGFLDAIMPLFSLTWLLWALGIAAFALWALFALRRQAKWKSLRPVMFGSVLILTTAGVTDLLTVEVKDHIGRLRPYQSLPFAHYQTNSGWKQNPEMFKPRKNRADSFYSGHAAHSMAVAVTAATLCPPLSPVIYAMPLVVGYSRVYLGKHYPSDVLVGWLAGACVALLARRLTRNYRKNLKPDKEPIQAPPRPVSLFSACRAKFAAGSTRQCNPSRTSQGS